MNSTLQLPRPSAAGSFLARGIPFSTRLISGGQTGSSSVVLGHRAFLRAWAARRAAMTALPVRRAL